MPDKEQKLTAAKVDEIIRKCLFKEGEPTEDKVVADGIMSSFGFHPGRLEENKPVIKELLNELPDTFMASGGGGMSFLNACMDKHENHANSAARCPHSLGDVDLFAPGVKIYSSLPDENYDYLSGTSMATPEVSGIAALLRSQRPDLTAPQIRDVLMKTTRKFNGLIVKLPGLQIDTTLDQLSTSGGIVDAFSAYCKLYHLEPDEAAREIGQR